MVNWVKEAWQQLSTDVIVRFFEACGITSNDPDHIHCTKEGGIAEAAREALKDLDESLLNVDTNCEDTDEDSDCDDNEEIGI